MPGSSNAPRSYAFLKENADERNDGIGSLGRHGRNPRGQTYFWICGGRDQSSSIRCCPTNLRRRLDASVQFPVAGICLVVKTFEFSELSRPSGPRALRDCAYSIHGRRRVGPHGAVQIRSLRICRASRPSGVLNLSALAPNKRGRIVNAAPQCLARPGEIRTPDLLVRSARNEQAVFVDQ